MKQEGARETAQKSSVVLAAVALMAMMGDAPAQSTTVNQTSGDLVVRLEIVALADVESDSMHLLERQLHRDVKPAGRIYHVLVGVYDSTTVRRSSEVEAVSAKVIDSFGTTPATRLEPMSEGGEVGYGNYFDFGPSGPYRIVITVVLRGDSRSAEVTFNLAHLPE